MDGAPGGLWRLKGKQIPPLRYGMEMLGATELKCKGRLVEICVFPPIAKRAMDGAPGGLWWLKGKQIPPLRYGIEMQRATELKCKGRLEWKCK